MASRIISTAGAVLMLATLIAPGVRAESAGDVNQIDGISLHGFDPVAYFTEISACAPDPVGVALRSRKKRDPEPPPVHTLHTSALLQHCGPRAGGFRGM